VSSRYLLVVLGLTLAAARAAGQPAANLEAPPVASAGASLPAEPSDAAANPSVATGLPGLSDALRNTLDALGASTGVPDGAGLSWYPQTSVRGQSAAMTLMNYQFGFTAPVYAQNDQMVFADAVVRTLNVQTRARLPTDRVKFPHEFWDIEGGGGYVGQLASGWSWGATMNLGTASNRPFHSLGEAILSALAFVRAPADDRDAWLFYVVSTSNGQLGRNIPVPGVAYEYHADKLTAVVGFPFVTIDYRPTQALQLEFTYAAITDVMARTSWHITTRARLFGEFDWANQAWFRADRPDQRDQFFMYEKRLGPGFGWQIEKQLDLRLFGGYVFDRFFVENHGLSFSGRNRVDLAPGAFLSAQLEFKY
jgi:hypothetical protein